MIDLDKAKRYNEWRRGRGDFDADDFKRMVEVLGEERIVAMYQEYRGLAPVDGMFGPGTAARLHADSPPLFLRPGEIHETPRAGALADLEVDHEGVIRGDHVRVELAYPGWYYPKLLTQSGQPEAIDWHYTATGPGTAKAMSRFRQQTVAQARAQRDSKWGPSSWHFCIETDGVIWQMVRLFHGAWAIVAVKGLNWDNPPSDLPPIAPNHRDIHVELVSRNGIGFTDEQVEAAERITRLGATQFGIPRHEHYSHDERSRGTQFHHRDPGPEWMDEHLPGILDRVYGEDRG